MKCQASGLVREKESELLWAASSWRECAVAVHVVCAREREPQWAGHTSAKIHRRACDINDDGTRMRPMGECTKRRAMRNVNASN